MAKLIQKTTQLYVDKYSLGGDMHRIGLASAADIIEGSVFSGGSTHQKYGGLKTVDASADGYFDAAAGHSDPVLFTDLRLADIPWTVAPTDGSEGQPAYTFRALVAQYSPLQSAVGEMAKFSARGAAAETEGLIRGTVMLQGITVPKTVTGVGPITQLGAASASQFLYAALHLISVTGSSPTLDVTVKSAAAVGFGSPTTRMTIPTQNAPASVWATRIAGPITDQYWRVDYAIGGTGGPSFGFVVVVGIQ
jgi:hypothetical protein